MEPENKEELDVIETPDVSGSITITEPPRVAYESREIEVGKLKIRPQYQRPLSEQRVRKMVANFDDSLLGTIEVSFAEGHYWVVDGQHRLAVMRQKNIRTCRVLIHYDLTIEQEAHLFSKLNSQRMAALPRDLYKAELVEGAERSIAVRDTLAKYGLKVELNTGNNRNNVAAVGHLWELQADHVLDDALKLIINAWSDGESIPIHGALEGRTLAALGRFIATYRTHKWFKMDRLTTALMKHRPDELIREARSYGSSWRFGSAITLLRWYNFNLQNKLPEAK